MREAELSCHVTLRFRNPENESGIQRSGRVQVKAGTERTYSCRLRYIQHLPTRVTGLTIRPNRLNLQGVCHHNCIEIKWQWPWPQWTHQTDMMALVSWY